MSSSILLSLFGRERIKFSGENFDQTLLFLAILPHIYTHIWYQNKGRFLLMVKNLLILVPMEIMLHIQKSNFPMRYLNLYDLIFKKWFCR